ncbi:putative ester cyclase [Methanolinea mesophila]|uniref:ester cyclase n=1 Tax=Methanolinea mesophila TaxID=547055 RepID=UPI001AE19DE0|nr:ester cyclase [Methanolinea mesophila]MBP1927572.1 putative ester cyclase [Methanolinea mesophila]
MKDLRAAFPDLQFFPEGLVAEGDLVAVRYHWTGTRTGRFLGLAPTGTQVLVK